MNELECVSKGDCVLPAAKQVLTHFIVENLVIFSLRTWRFSRQESLLLTDNVWTSLIQNQGICMGVSSPIWLFYFRFTLCFFLWNSYLEGYESKNPNNPPQTNKQTNIPPQQQQNPIKKSNKTPTTTKKPQAPTKQPKLFVIQFNTVQKKNPGCSSFISQTVELIMKSTKGPTSSLFLFFWVMHSSVMGSVSCSSNSYLCRQWETSFLRSQGVMFPRRGRLFGAQMEKINWWFTLVTQILEHFI